MAEQTFRYTMNVTIKITGTEAKKDTVRDSVVAILQNARDAGNIDEAAWSVSQTLIPEGGVVK